MSTSPSSAHEAIPERVTDSRLKQIFGSTERDRPPWMLNDSVRDSVWIVPKVGLEPASHHRGTRPLNTNLVDFRRDVAPGASLTSDGWSDLFLDLQDSCLYLDLVGAVTRPSRFSPIVVEACDFIYFLNERPDREPKRPVLSLEQITDLDLIDYLKAFDVPESQFTEVLRHVLARYEDRASIDWDDVRIKFACPTRRHLSSLKDRVEAYLAANHPRFRTDRNAIREFPNASLDFDLEVDLAPNERSITNRIGLLELLFRASAVQRRPLRVSPRRVCGDGKDIMCALSASRKTPAIPLNVALHAISSALHFATNYGTALHRYLVDLDSGIDNLREESGFSTSTFYARIGTRAIRDEVFSRTEQPKELGPLKIDNWTTWSGGNRRRFGFFRQGMPLAIAFVLYSASMWILINAFAATRIVSMRTLRRSCFEESPIDGLFDLRLLQAKSSIRNELEEIRRPIPRRIFDLGLDFSSCASYLETRRGIVRDDEISFLFNRTIFERSILVPGRVSLPKAYADTPLSNDSVAYAIDLFLDWSESPVIDQRRWYFAPHQLRRLFAILYFNMAGDGGLEELAWFLGHEDMDKAFHYAELGPSEEWMDEAIKTIARISTGLRATLHSDASLKAVVSAAQPNGVSLMAEVLVEQAIRRHLQQTGEEVRFKRISDNDIFFYFVKAG